MKPLHPGEWDSHEPGFRTAHFDVYAFRHRADGGSDRLVFVGIHQASHMPATVCLYHDGPCNGKWVVDAVAPSHWLNEGAVNELLDAIESHVQSPLTGNFGQPADEPALATWLASKV